MSSLPDLFRELGITVFERGWLSSNNIVVRERDGDPAVIIDTGYDSHVDQTLRLLESLPGSAPRIGRIISTHLHSDHCGGNAAIAARWGCEVWAPQTVVDALARWSDDIMHLERTGQRCSRFQAARGLAIGELVELGRYRWRVVGAPGHDPDSIMLFQPESGVLISADALWEERVAIVFPALEGDSGFDEALSTLDVIEKLAPRIVIPGHGRPFTDAAGAVKQSRQRLTRFRSDPGKHLDYALRALTMFRMLELRRCGSAELQAWLERTPMLGQMLRRLPGLPADARSAAQSLVERLVADRLLKLEADGLLVLG